MCIVKPDGPPQLCKTDEIGEIVINSRAGGTMYYGLHGVTKNTFEVCQCGLGSVSVPLHCERYKLVQKMHGWERTHA